MKKAVLFLSFLAFSIMGFAKINTGVMPLSFRNGKPVNDGFQKVKIAPPILNKIDLEDREAAKNGTILAIAKLIPVGLTTQTGGTWMVDDSGRDIWKLQLYSPGAKGCVVHFSRFAIPEGGQLFVYNPDGSVILGPFTSADNPKRLSYSIGMIYGNEAIVEYIAPRAKVANGKSLRIEPDLEISRFAYVFRDVIDLRKNTSNIDASGSCQVNVNCSEGDNWREQQRSVARIYVVEDGMGGWCTGSLINNLKNDGRPFFLTADHCCGENGTFSEWNFFFNYETLGCSTTSSGPVTVINGCTRKARAPLNGASDFLLLELNTTKEQIEEFSGVFNGWTTAILPNPSGVGIHHPAGDVKKISTYTLPLTSTTYLGQSETGALNAHWEVYWSATTNGHGTTEGGSSGSPIFNNNGYVVGTLSGGSSSCDAVNASDLYGKFSVHWAAYSDTLKQLKHWLDPDKTGATVCELYDPGQGFKVKPEILKFAKEADSKQVTVQAGASANNWMATSDQMWLSVSPATGAGGGATTTLTVTVTANTGNNKRLGTITVTHGGETKTIAVQQSGTTVYGFSYDFEKCNDFAVDSFPPCTTYDGDGSPTYTISDVTFRNEGYTGSFIAFNHTKTSPPVSGNWAAYEGERCGICMAATSGVNNDWFITPLVKLANNSRFQFFAKSATSSYGLEEFNVLVSTTGNQPANFTALGSTIAVPDMWQNYSYDLSAYNNQSVYLAIQCVSQDRFGFMIDNLEVLTDEPVGLKTLSEDADWDLFVKDGVLFVEVSQNAKIEVFNMIGQKIYSRIASENLNAITNLPKAQVLVVRCGEKSKRVIL